MDKNEEEVGPHFTLDPNNCCWEKEDEARENRIYAELRKRGFWGGEGEPETPNCNQVELKFFGGG